MQAIALIRDASQYDDVALAVSWSGDVREANVVERVIYGIIDFLMRTLRNVEEMRHERQ